MANLTVAGADVRPIPGTERIIALDALRGFALLGILLVNVLGFSGIRALGAEAEGLDRVLEFFLKYFGQGKFMSLFALMFGISFTLQLASLQRQGTELFPTYWRRLVTLFLLGIMHTLLEPSEVLAVYALCGALLLFFRKVPEKGVLVIAILMLGLPHLHTAIVTPVYVADTAIVAQPESSTESGTQAATEDAVEPVSEVDDAASSEDEEMHAWDPYLGELAIRIHSSASFTEVVQYNNRFTIRRWTGSWVAYLWMLVPLPMMMLGMLIGRSGILTRLHQEKTRLKMTFWLGLVAGIIAMVLAYALYGQAGRNGWNPWIAFPASWLYSLSGLIMALAYSAGLSLLLQLKLGTWLQAILAPVGRMALTNYLLQTVIGTSLFFGFGLGLYGRLGASQAVLAALVIFILQIALSRLWLGVFQFGPVEWLWRMATYWRVLPLRIATADSESSK